MSGRELFDFQKLQDEFRAMRTPENNILIDEYATTFLDIASFFDLLGMAFSFVAKDVREKVKILRAHRAESPDQFVTLQAMVSHETSANLTRTKTPKSGLVSGTRTLLRLHFTLDFVLRFLGRLKDMPDDEPTSRAASEEYKETLAKHEPWMIQKLAGLAIRTLPTRKVFMEKNVKQPKDELEIMAAPTIKLMREVFDITEKLYAEKDLLDLP